MDCWRMAIARKRSRCAASCWRCHLRQRTGARMMTMILMRLTISAPRAPAAAVACRSLKASSERWLAVSTYAGWTPHNEGPRFTRLNNNPSNRRRVYGNAHACRFLPFAGPFWIGIDARLSISRESPQKDTNFLPQKDANFRPLSSRIWNPGPSAALNPHRSNSSMPRRLECCFTASAPPKSQNYGIYPNESELG